MKSLVYVRNVHCSITDAVKQVLAASKIEQCINSNRIVIKPNILSKQLPPKTTDPFVVLALVEYLRDFSSDIEIVIAEGCCDPNSTTDELFNYHRYDIIAKRFNTKLIDLNTYPSTEMSRTDAVHLKTFLVSDIFTDSFIISVPVLKGHGLVVYTGALKNMFGVAPAYGYSVIGHAKKFKLHQDIPNSIVDINRYVHIDYTLMDASIGLMDHHIKGKPCIPHRNIICGGYDPVAVDAYSINLLYKNKTWKDVNYMHIANGVLGTTNYEVIECKS